MKRVVLDTDVLIDFLRQPKKPALFKRLVESEGLEILLPAVVLTELYIGKSAVRSSQVGKLKQILEETKLVLADENISKTAGVLMRDFPHLYLADALVAATALEKKASLCTFNKSHFEEVAPLKLY